MIAKDFKASFGLVVFTLQVFKLLLYFMFSFFLVLAGLIENKGMGFDPLLGLEI